MDFLGHFLQFRFEFHVFYDQLILRHVVKNFRVNCIIGLKDMKNIDCKIIKYLEINSFKVNPLTFSFWLVGASQGRASISKQTRTLPPSMVIGEPDFLVLLSID